MKENDIRPDDMNEYQQKYIISDRDRLLSFSKEFVNVVCPACEKSDSKHAFQKNKINYVNCNNCSTMYVNPRPTEKILNYCYSHSDVYEYWNKSIFPASEDVRKEKIFIPRLNRIQKFCEKYNVDKNLLIEVGAGYGTFSEVVNEKKTFKKVIAIEPSPESVNSCKSKGIEVINDFIENVNLDNHIVNVIASFEVIEHLFSPINFIKECFRILSPGGLLVLTCPNIHGFDIGILQDKSQSVDHEHLNYFNPFSLKTLVEKCGFTTLEVLTPGELDVEILYKTIQRREYEMPNNSFIKNLLINRYDELKNPLQTFLKDNLLSSHLWIVAKK
tara:strand:- start:829 stop:1818 length:990 start_codon:yes stop_codon:yes gene_type:complete